MTVDEELLDLLPLFLGEARERVAHLRVLAPELGTSAPALIDARREFHTLKGSCRMLKLLAMGDLCHQGEELLDVVVPGSGDRVTELLDAFSGMLEAVGRGPAAAGAAAAAERGAGAVPAAEVGAAPRHPEDELEPGDPGTSEHPLAAPIAAALAAGAADLRVGAPSGLSLAERVAQLARLAEGGVLEPRPEQVLATLSSSLRQLAGELEGNERRLLQRAEEPPDTVLALQLQPLPLRVLLVEDSLVTRERERRLLEDEGFDVLAVPAAEEALAALARQPFDCVVTDIEMPEMNGLELTRRLRAIERFAQLPIVVVSTLDRPEERLAGLLAGADAYLSKHELQPREIGGLIRRLGGAARMSGGR